MNRFHQRTALVTGGRSGIGHAVAGRLASEGARVFTAQRQLDPNFEGIIADFADPAAPEAVISEIVSKAGTIDILVNNAGVMKEGTVEEMSVDDWHHTLAVNLTAPFLLAKYAMPHLKGGGSIVNVGSIEGLGSNPRHPAYGASKAGLHGLTRAMAIDHGPDGVRCNAVAPGWIDTDLNDAFIDSFADPDAFRSNLSSIHPSGRTGTPQDVAALIAFLVSDDAAFITGQVYTVDGGRMAKLSLP
ncbi:MAG: SDR family oxidoreductase [Alphaproteobacteria bacterium]|nr:SDR family oxidoreductase [Alphaproteobacteria bacterium]